MKEWVKPYKIVGEDKSRYKTDRKTESKEVKKSFL